MKDSKILGFDKNIFFSGLTSFFTDVSTKMVYSIMPLFLLSIGATKTTISLIEGIAESTASILKAVSGILSDKIKKNKPFMIIGYGLTALITPIYYLVKLPIHVLILRFFERIGKGLRTAPRDSLISSSVNKNETGKSFGFHKTMDNSGAIIGPLSAFLLLNFLSLDFKYIFIISAIPAFLGVLTIILFIKDKEIKTKKETEKIKFIPKLLPNKFYFFLFIIFIFSLGNSTDALLLVKTSETGIKQTFIPFIYMIFNTVSVIISVPIGKLSDKIGREKMIISGYIIYSIVYFLFGSFNNISIFISLFVLYGFYSALTDGAQKSMVSDIIKKELKGTGFGIYHSILGITLLPASLIAGFLYDKINSSAPFFFGGTMSLIAAILMIIFAIYNNLEKKNMLKREPGLN